MQLACATLRSQPYGFLATCATTGPNVRLVQHLRIDDDAGVWIGTSPRSRKVREVQQRPAATYAVEDRASFAYAAVCGRAELVDDLDLRRALWEPGLQAFFPAGPGGDDFVLLHVVPSTVEVMSFAHGVHPDPYGLRAAAVDVAGGDGTFGERRGQA